MNWQSIQPRVYLVMLLVGLYAPEAIAGTLMGQVVSTAGHAGVKDAIVWAEPAGPLPAFPSPTQHAEMAQVKLAFTPRILPVLVGTTVDFPNRDTVYHSVYSFSRHQRFEIGLYKPGESRSVTFDKVGLVKLFCNIHDQMFGAIMVLSTPYFTTTAPDGTFRLAGVPGGKVTVHIWHERLQGTPQTVSLVTKGTLKLRFMLHPKRHAR